MVRINATINGRDKQGQKYHVKHCIFSDEEWNRLKSDWLSYIETGKPEGGAYRYDSNEAYEDNQTRELLLRFDDIASIA